MLESIWIEGPNYAGFWQKIFYPNFVYCSHCSKFGHAWEQCFKRKENQNKQKGKDAPTYKQPHVQQNTRMIPTWHQPRRRQQYVPRNTDVAGPSGTKDSQGCVIHDTTQTVSNRVEEDKSPTMDMDKEAEEPSRQGVPMQNAFAALNILEDEDEIIPHIPLRRTQAAKLDKATSGPHIAPMEQAHETHREVTEALADLSPNEDSIQLAIVVASEQPQLANPNRVSSPILDPISSNPNLHDGIFIVSSSPLMLTNGDSEDDYEETVPETASYGSDTEVRGRKSFKTYAPALMMIRYGSNNLAESRAILDGIQACYLMGYHTVQLQCDSQLAVNWFYNLTSIPWSLRIWWRHIHAYKDKMKINCFHVFREGNQPADYLSKLGLAVKGNGGANKNLDRVFKKLLLADKMEIPNLRVSKK
ncbi:hypothetical protein FRX31_005655 [Thalictrum thalictroides]|uniref:RNase H type-1 domain-containing protein n=1 Tax=Thalictrum thalictroides TaxID=46969 RepID=A0A7J6X4V5_THATH|nr:hypothetical protein FRX31_005655 [Thalictrum thalictroides]